VVIKVLIAEDVHMVRGALVALLSLESDIEVVAEVAGGNDIMPFAKYIGPDINGFAGNAFNRVLTAIDTRENVFNLETRPRGIGRRNLQHIVEERMSPSHAGFLRSGLLHYFPQTWLDP